MTPFSREGFILGWEVKRKGAKVGGILFYYHEMCALYRSSVILGSSVSRRRLGRFILMRSGLAAMLVLGGGWLCVWLSRFVLELIEVDFFLTLSSRTPRLLVSSGVKVNDCVSCVHEGKGR
jgi:hypothetical protein